LKAQDLSPPLFVREGGVLSLSGEALEELLRAVLDRGLPFRFQAKGFSMLPFVKHGDVITVVPPSTTSPRLGDVVAFVHPEMERIAVHRVVGRKGDVYLIRGDNNQEVDGMVSEANILGRVVRVERGGRRVYVGLGPERFLIAYLTRRGLLQALLRPLWRLVRPIVQRVRSRS
jgi:signal peptidase I